MKPLAPITDFTPDTWDFFLWTDIFVSPIVNNASTQPEQVINFPQNDNWINWWNSSYVYQGGSILTTIFPLNQFPAYQRQGAILPLNVTNSLNNNGDEYSKGHLTLLINRPVGYEKKVIRYWRDISQEVQYTCYNNVFQFNATAHTKPIILLLRGVIVLPHSQVIDVESKSLLTQYKAKLDLSNAMKGYYYDIDTYELWIRPGKTAAQRGFGLIITDIDLSPCIFYTAK